MKRPLESIAGGFVLGEVLALLPVAWRIVISAVILAGVWLLWERKGRSWLWWLLPVCCVLGTLRLQADQKKAEEYQITAERLEGRSLTVGGMIRGMKEDEEDGRVTLELGKVSLEYDGRTHPYGTVIAYVDRVPEGSGGRALCMGMRVSLRGKLKPFEEPGNPGEFDYGTYYRSLGIAARCFGEGLEVKSSAYSPLFQGIYRLKVHAGKVLDSVCTEKDRGIFRAIVLGEKSDLSDEIRKLYQKSGISHLLAISGLHISMIGMGAFGLCRKMGLGFGWAGAIGGGVTVCYGILAGGSGVSASVVRAVIMVSMQMAAGGLGRTYDMRTAASVSGLCLLLQSPTLLFQAGFQLSFGAVFALGAAVPAAAGWLRVESAWGKTLLAGGIVQLATCPVILYHYFEYPVYGILLNLVVIPLMSYVLLSGILGAAAGTAAVWLGEVAVGTGHYVLEFYEWLCRAAGRLPGALLITGRPSMGQIAVYGFLWFGLLAWAGARKEREEGQDQEEDPIEKRKRWALWVSVAAASLFLLMVRPPMRGMEVTCLDVGQGDGICIRTRDTVILVDAGSSDKKGVGEQVLIPFLKSQGVSRVDCAIVSHGDSDHISGLLELLKEDSGIQVGQLILPSLGQGLQDASYEELEELGRKRGIKTMWMKRGDGLASGDLRIRCLYAGEKETKERNEHSLLLEVRYGRTGILLTGDMSAEGERQWLAKGDEVQIQVLKVAHHGSGYSTGKEFLRKVAPKYGMISCGEKNRYGHPSPETLTRLEEQGVRCYDTEKGGAIQVKTDGEGLTISSFQNSGQGS